MDFLPPKLTFPVRNFEDLQKALEEMYRNIYLEISTREIHRFVDIGDPGVSQYNHSTLTCDDTWKTGASAMDFSSVVPAGSTWVYIHAYWYYNGTNYFGIRTPGQTSARVWLYTSTGQGSLEHNLFIPLDSTRKIEYKGLTTFSTLYIHCQGWFI